MQTLVGSTVAKGSTSSRPWGRVVIFSDLMHLGGTQRSEGDEQGVVLVVGEHGDERVQRFGSRKPRVASVMSKMRCLQKCWT